MKIVKNLSKSIYPIKYHVKGSFNLGEICPIGAPLEVIPGDYFKLDMAIALRMATPIAPIMDDLDAEITAHFVPLRLISTYYGDVTDQAYQTGYYTYGNRFEAIIGNGLGNPVDWQQTNHEIYAAPTADWTPSAARSAGFTTIGEALGLGLGVSGGSASDIEVLAYPLYGYGLIYQARFRNENVEAGKRYDYTSNVYGKAGAPNATSDDATAGTYNQGLSVAYKHGDIFQNAVPSPTKSAAIGVPLGDYAPVITGNVDNAQAYGTSPYNLVWLSKTSMNNPSASGYIAYNDTGATKLHTTGSDYSTDDEALPKNLIADLKAASASTIENFVTAYNVQRLLMNDIKGTRYYEIIVNHYGIKNEDIELYIPELLQYRRFPINVSTVVQQSGSAASTSATDQGNFLGTTGGYSFTGNKGSLVHHAFGEFGYIYFLIVCRQTNTYGQGIPKLYERSTRFDFFFPELGRIGYQKLKKTQLNADDTSGGVYGYIPAWEELRQRGFNQTFGLLNPIKSNSLDYWTLAERMTATPTLSISFMKENRTKLADALTIGSTGPDFIMDALIYGSVSTFVPIGNTPKLFD